MTFNGAEALICVIERSSNARMPVLMMKDSAAYWLRNQMRSRGGMLRTLNYTGYIHTCGGHAPSIKTEI